MATNGRPREQQLTDAGMASDRQPPGAIPAQIVLQVRDEHLAALTLLTRLTSLRLVHGKYAWDTKRFPVEITPAGDSTPAALCP